MASDPKRMPRYATGTARLSQSTSNIAAMWFLGQYMEGGGIEGPGKKR